MWWGTGKAIHTRTVVSAPSGTLHPAKLLSLYLWTDTTDPNILWRAQKAETHSLSTESISVIIDTNKGSFDPDKEKSPRLRVFCPHGVLRTFVNYPKAGRLPEGSRQRLQWVKNLLFCQWMETETNWNSLWILRMLWFKITKQYFTFRG